MKFRDYPFIPNSFSEYRDIEYKSSATFELTPQSFIDALSQHGLFDQLPEEAKKKNMESLESWPSSTDYHCHLYGSSYTGEFVYEPGDHLKSFQDLCLHSYDLISPTEMNEEWKDGKAHVTVLHSGETFSHSWEVESDYPNLEFYKFIDSIVYSVSPHICLKLYKDKMMIVNQKGFRECVYRKILPVRCYEHGIDTIDHA